MEAKFVKATLNHFLPDSFKGLSKPYIMDAVFNDEIQSKWGPQVGDVIVGSTGNIFVIGGVHRLSGDIGGDKYFFAPGLCNRGDGCFLDSTYTSVLNKDGKKHEPAQPPKDDPFYSAFSEYRYVPYPHEL